MASAAIATTATAALLVALSLLFTGADARPGVHFHPCNTLFISYTISSSSDSTLDVAQIAASSANPKPLHSFAVFRIVRPLRPYHYTFPQIDRPIRVERHQEAAAEASAFGMSSFQDRAKDILFVAVGLLFGVACGALTGATLFLAWSFVANRYEMCGSDDDEEAADETMGYVTIADPAPVMKEGYEPIMKEGYEGK